MKPCSGGFKNKFKTNISYVIFKHFCPENIKFYPKTLPTCQLLFDIELTWQMLTNKNMFN